MTRLIALVVFLSFWLAGLARSETCDGRLTYLSSSVEVYAYLENVQRELYESNPRLVHDPYLRDQLSDRTSAKTWDELVERLIGQGIITRADGDNIGREIRCLILPTKYESPITYILLKNTLDGMKETERKYFPDAKNVYFGTLPTATIQAQAIVPLGFSDPIIILNRDVFHFTGKFSKAISAAIPIERDDQGNVVLSYDEALIRKRLQENPWIVDDFAQAMFLMVTSGSPAAAQEEMLDTDHNLLHARLVGGLDAFIVGHELSHILLGHTATTRTYAFPDDEETGVQAKQVRTIDVVVADYEGNQELAADELSLRLFLRNEMKDGTDGLLSAAIGAAGGDLFFLLIDLHDKYASMLGRPPMHGGKHPPAAVRSTNLDKVFASNEVMALGVNEMPDFRLLTRMSFKVLSEQADPRIIKALKLYSQSH